jgi:dGTPase
MSHWNQLYTTARLQESKEKSIDTAKIRTSFMRDYDRIIFSHPFRKLQNKTQVFPLPGIEFVHNRLTHSLEVASVGRSIGKIVGAEIVKQHAEGLDEWSVDFYENELDNVIAAACLAHDIGNPPFGHSGEEAIRNFFINIKGDVKRHIHQALTNEELADLERFEGNSNALRVLTHRFNATNSAFNLTLTTLASIIKYPTSAYEGFKKKSGNVALKKSGYFQTEKAVFKTIMDAFGLYDYVNKHYNRHPFVYLVEAADDICYRIIDMEDAHRIGILTYSVIEDLFLPFFKNETGFNALNKVTAMLNSFETETQKVQYLRARWIGLMVDKVAQTFIKNQVEILKGTFNSSLLDSINSEYSTLVNRINNFSNEFIYNNKNVVEVELAGFNVLGTLLEAFVEALLYESNLKSEKLLALIEPYYVIDRKSRTLYKNLLSIVDFISGMTDNYAIDLYRKIKGIEITGSIRL